MSYPIRALAPTLCALVALSALSGVATAAPQGVEGTNYRTLDPPQPTESPGKIEVIEFFSYACPHCNDFYPLVSSWAAQLPKDVVFKRVPVGFDRLPWINLQRAYYALEASGDLMKLDGKLFHAIHVEQLPLFDEPHLAEWVGQNGGSAEKFASAYTSFSVNNKTVQADELAEHYQVTGIPTMAVGGKYIALGDSHSAILANTDQLIARVRSEGPVAKSGGKPAQ
ncbi:MAG TPA: thiol:disulfide interchange protein DsbA/DsbL [Steroidobacteraceae bacterium]|nr:thiol:disulfide interchange protein DsbA/DsbL [Steroidobacteraceae bacterium]